MRLSLSPPLPGGEREREKEKESEIERRRKTGREKKRAKLEYDSINPAIERVEWQAGGDE